MVVAGLIMKSFCRACWPSWALPTKRQVKWLPPDSTVTSNVARSAALPGLVSGQTLPRLYPTCCVAPFQEAGQPDIPSSDFPSASIRHIGKSSHSAPAPSQSATGVRGAVGPHLRGSDYIDAILDPSSSSSRKVQKIATKQKVVSSPPAVLRRWVM